MVIAFPPCTYLAASGACWWKMRQIEQQEAIKFFMLFTNLHHIPKVCIENPVGIMSRMYRKPDQIINPYHFGHVEKKRTCLWLKGLAPLMYTNIVPKEERVSFVNHVKKGPDRAKNRSLTFEGVARAMGEQWS